MALLDERRLLDAEELGGLAVVPDESVMGLASLAHEVRLAWCGPTVEVEGILSAKTGGCPEDCHFCAQSSRFDTPVKATPFLDTDEVLARRGRDRRAGGVGVLHRPGRARAPTSASWRGCSSSCPWCGSGPGSTWPCRPASSPTTRPGAWPRAGVHRYNHNLETARSFFPSVVTTHGWDERAETCRLVRDHGMELCCGALVGMGESDAQRVELLLQLRELDPTEVPVNFLNPRPGTPARRPARGGGLGGHPLDRAVPPGAARA